MKTLHLPLKAEYFDAIKRMEKRYEYRLVCPYWRKRLEGKEYDDILLTKGYPSKKEHSRRLRRPWRSWWVETIVHQHFGSDPVKVYVIPVN
jgi:hypothetical protein